MQVNGVQMPQHGPEGGSGIGVLLGWAMAALYMSGRLPQILLNVSYILVPVRSESFCFREIFSSKLCFWSSKSMSEIEKNISAYN